MTVPRSLLLRVGLLFASIGALAGFGASFFVPHRYRARAVAEFVRGAGMPEDFYRSEAGSVFESASMVTLSNASLQGMLQRTDALRTRLYTYSAASVVEEIRRDISIEKGASGKSTTAVIEFEDDDRDTASAVVQALLSIFTDNARKSSPDAQDPTRVIQIPYTRPAGLTPALLTCEGALAGLATGILVCGIAFLASRGT